MIVSIPSTMTLIASTTLPSTSAVTSPRFVRSPPAISVAVSRNRVMFRWSSSRFRRSSSRSASVRIWPRSRPTVSLNVWASWPISSVDRTGTSTPRSPALRRRAAWLELLEGLADAAAEDGAHRDQARGRHREHPQEEAGQRAPLGASWSRAANATALSWRDDGRPPEPLEVG